MRVKVTTEIEATLKLQYDAVQDPARPTLRQLIEAGMLNYLEEKDATQALTLRIEAGERELSELRQQLAALRILDPQQTRIIQCQEENKARQAELQKYLEMNKERYKDGVKRGWLNYQNLAQKFDFNSPADCKRWVMQVVKSWEAIHEKGRSPIPAQA